MERESPIPNVVTGTRAAVLADRFANISFMGWKGHATRPPAKSAPVRKERPAPLPRTVQRVEIVDEEAVEFIHAVVSRAGLDLGHYRLAPLLRRIPACLRLLRVDSIAKAHAMLRSREDLLLPALDSLLIGTTEFFRDAPVFEELGARIMPELTRLGRAPRVWSVACSEGVELYSVAMLLARRNLLEKGALLGTDCRQVAIDRARHGVYPTSCLAQIPGEHHRAFVPLGKSGVRIREDLRAATRWEVADALLPPAETGWDLILCRNFTIYLGPEAANRLWASLASALNPGGFLVVGKAEKPRIPELTREGHSVYRKRPFSTGC